MGEGGGGGVRGTRRVIGTRAGVGDVGSCELGSGGRAWVAGAEGRSTKLAESVMWSEGVRK